MHLYARVKRGEIHGLKGRTQPVIDAAKFDAVTSFLDEAYATALGLEDYDYDSLASGWDGSSWSSYHHEALDITSQVKAFFEEHGITDDVGATVMKWKGKEAALLKRMDAHVAAVEKGEEEGEEELLHGVLTTGEVLW